MSLRAWLKDRNDGKLALTECLYQVSSNYLHNCDFYSTLNVKNDYLLFIAFGRNKMHSGPSRARVKLSSNESLATHQISTQFDQLFARSGKLGVHVRTCRCTTRQTCVKLLSHGPVFAHIIWTRSAQPFTRSGKRDVHVRTCRYTSPQTCVKLLSNGSLFTHKIWTRFA